ncbi:MAG: hypothetical protein V7637_4113 [Mycobacteriales bacterium]|jgi:uncharacterized protein (DUF885 family)
MTVVDQVPANHLASLAERAWETVIAGQPMLATAYGDHRFDDRIDDLSPAAGAAVRAGLTALRDEAEALPADSLPAADRITRSALLGFVDSEIADHDRRYAGWPIDPLNAPQVALPHLAAVHQAADPAQGRVMVTRWRALGPHVDQYAANVTAALADGLVAPAVLVRKAVGQLDRMLAEPVEKWALTAPAHQERPGWPAAERSRFAADLTAAVADGLAPALRRLREVLATEVLPAARPDDRVGISELPGGAAGYQRALRGFLSRDVAPADLHQLGLAELDRIDAELTELGGRLFGARNLAGVLRRLRSDPALRFADRDEVLATAIASTARAESALDGWFGLRPPGPCEVTAMLPHEEATSPAAKYYPPAPDGSRPGRYYVNLSLPEQRPRYDAEALAFHEAVPGHHQQIAVAQQLGELPTFRRFGMVTVYVEGWGLYAERLADEMGLYSGDLDRLGILSFDSWRACRLVVDTGLHALGWSRQQAIDLLATHSAVSLRDIAVEVDRYIGWPGQATAYKFGQLELLRLRAEARRRAGDRYDVRAFHDAVLGSGALPLTALQEVVEQAFPGPGAVAGERAGGPPGAG